MPCCPSSFDQYNATEIVRHPLLSVTNGRCAAFCRSSCSLIRHLNARIIPQMSELSTKTCVPCRGGVPPLKGEDLAALEKQVDGWNVVEEHHITKTFKFPNFCEALTFREPRWRACGGARPPPGHLACLGKSGDYELDAQNQWADGERFHLGSQDRQALSNPLRV